MQLYHKKSIAEKLAEACDAVPALIKNGHRTEYNYLRIQDVAGAFWKELRSRGLFIVPNDVACFVSNDGFNAWVKTAFEVTDGDKTEIWFGYGQAQSSQGRALHIAQTTALKSWLKRLGMTFGEEDDAEFEGKHSEEPLMVEWPKTPPHPPVETQDRVDQATAENAARHAEMAKKVERGWNTQCHKFGKTIKQRREYLWTKWGVKTFAELPSKNAADEALAWAEGKEEPGKTLETSVESVKKGPQPVTEILDNQEISDPF